MVSLALFPLLLLDSIVSHGALSAVSLSHASLSPASLNHSPSLLGLSFASSPTEISTALTDLVLAAQCLLAIAIIQRRSSTKTFFSQAWTWAFALLGTSTLLGAAAHGLILPPSAFALLWIVLYLTLALLMAAFLLAAISFRFQPQTARRSLTPALLVALLFFTLTQISSGSFLLFILYEALVLIFSFAIYIERAVSQKPGSLLLASGVLLSILAAVLDAIPDLQLSLGAWAFDRHGIFHLVQMPSLLLLTLGVSKAIRSSKRLTQDDAESTSDYDSLLEPHCSNLPAPISPPKPLN